MLPFARPRSVLALLSGTLCFLFAAVPPAHGEITPTEIFPAGVQRVKVKDYGGQGGFWSMKYLDERGRVVTEENYRRRSLRYRFHNEYNDCDDIIRRRTSYDGNNRSRRDTVTFDFVYDGDCRVRTDFIRHAVSPSRIDLTDVSGDTLTYVTTSYHTRGKDTLQRSSSTNRYVFDAAGKMTYYETLFPERNFAIVEHYSYDSAGRLLHRTTAERVLQKGLPVHPYPPFECATCPPEASDQRWEYKLDKRGRPVRRHTILGDRRILVNKYKYYD